MKKQGILNAELAEVVAGMGHTDLLVIADAGFPVPPGVPCVDLAVRCGLPPMLDVTEAVADELEIEALTVADELLTRGSALPDALRQLFAAADFANISHDDLKQLSAGAKAVVRTGECTPYHNVILRAGVVFLAAASAAVPVAIMDYALLMPDIWNRDLALPLTSYTSTRKT